jgi:cyclic beta-1,2-glucan synthetase
MLGFEKMGDRVRLDPCIPTAWPGFALDYRFGASTYAVEVQNPNGVSRGVSATTVDGVVAPDAWIPLIDDGGRHTVTITLGPARNPVEASESAMAAAS